MKLFSIKYSSIALSVVVLFLSLHSCQKDNFTIADPGANIDPAGIAPTMTLQAFKQQYYYPVLGSAKPVKINDDQIISGVINADDSSGNYYKTITFQDATGGMLIKFNGSNLYHQYPRGRRIFIKTKGLYIFNYCGTAEIGSYIDTITSTFPSVGPLSSSDIVAHVIRGKWGLPVVPKTVTITDLLVAGNNGNPSSPGSFINMQSVLYKLDGVEFAATDTSSPYADQLNKASVNKSLTDCTNTIAVRTSGYAGFAGVNPAKGHGSVTGIYSFFSCTSNGTQFVIRDLADVNLTAARCH